ncbi:hypothetical protein PAAG_08484 [Paracoccidioides lutzii Pb01]|uniref:Uncharacterized protein n=1 Tax=Paracoccidioides lutzii (strain ATCC MYA-826 / Pb01) TaxID=502779 RepID=C1HCJ3_PARBA|nr:hypothetical protein PAAG_08484 [Paracoccidioides lutzii Pb01]EEH38757.2 hypothetical protein PAAG_08484 [Paracoccidioides lutzii Pb01]
MTSSRQSTVSRLHYPASKLEPYMKDCHRCEMTMEAEKTMSLSSVVDIVVGITPRKRLIWMDGYDEHFGSSIQLGIFVPHIPNHENKNGIAT